MATDTLAAFLQSADPMVMIEVSKARGSTPREAGAFMLVSLSGSAGTIGGGQLEYMAMDHARALLAGRTVDLVMSIPLGPEIGQCCGGRVDVGFAPVDDRLKAELSERLKREQASLPSVYLFGAGHVGLALVRSLSLLPLHLTVIETRQEEISTLPPGAEARLAAMPEAEVAGIAPGSAVIILTHDHALDFLIAAEALARTDLAYVGMIGSATKRATFASWLRNQAPAADIARLTLPIGGPLKDKRPEVIAALTAAEVMTALATNQSTVARTDPKAGQPMGTTK
jgi:xanthine dehydrogenase accessory factor